MILVILMHGGLTTRSFFTSDLAGAIVAARAREVEQEAECIEAYAIVSPELLEKDGFSFIEDLRLSEQPVYVRTRIYREWAETLTSKAA